MFFVYLIPEIFKIKHMNFIINLLVTAVSAFLLAEYIFADGVHIDGFMPAIIFALIFGIVNAIIKPILVVLTIPVTVLSLGLFIFVINALMVMLAAYFVNGIEIESFWWALGFSVLLAIVSSLLGSLVGVKK